MVLALLAQMFGEMVDALGEQRDLDLGGPVSLSSAPNLAASSRFRSVVMAAIGGQR